MYTTNRIVVKKITKNLYDVFTSEEGFNNWTRVSFKFGKLEYIKGNYLSVNDQNTVLHSIVKG